MADTGSDFTIRPEAEIDRPHIRDMHAAAFGDDKVPRLIDALRSTPAGNRTDVLRCRQRRSRQYPTLLSRSFGSHPMNLG
jgi:predicted N-acetyltransferase YhbS